jgi:hypothetical protein
MMTEPSTEFVFCKTLWNHKVATRDKEEYWQLSMHHKVYLCVPTVSIYSEFVKEKRKHLTRILFFMYFKHSYPTVDINIFVLINLGKLTFVGVLAIQFHMEPYMCMDTWFIVCPHVQTSIPTCWYLYIFDSSTQLIVQAISSTTALWEFVVCMSIRKRKDLKYKKKICYNDMKSILNSLFEIFYGYWQHAKRKDKYPFPREL